MASPILPVGASSSVCQAAWRALPSGSQAAHCLTLIKMGAVPARLVVLAALEVQANTVLTGFPWIGDPTTDEREGCVSTPPPPPPPHTHTRNNNTTEICGERIDTEMLTQLACRNRAR